MISTLRRNPAMIVSAVALVVAIAAAALWAYVRQSQPPAPQPPTDAEISERAAEAVIAAARSTIKRALRDPESARFRKGSIATAKLDDGSGRANQVACGYVNSKNGFGGYTGEQPWWVVRFWNGESALCVNKLEECDFRVLAAMEEANACLNSLGP